MKKYKKNKVESFIRDLESEVEWEKKLLWAI